MNQILFNFNNDSSSSDINWNTKKDSFFKRKKTVYFSIFIFLIVTILIIFCYILYNKYNLYKKNKNSNDLINTYNISTLYSSSNYYTAIQLSNNLSIIGLIEIPEINISYPILSEVSEEALKTSVCRFSRPTSKSCRQFMYCWT